MGVLFKFSLQRLGTSNDRTQTISPNFLSGVRRLDNLAVPFEWSSSAESDRDTGRQHSPGRFGDIQESTVFDVCIIGSGFAGAVLGEALVRHGIKTVILESGPDPRERSIDPRFQQLDSYRSSGPINYPVVSSRFRGVGGTSWLWGGICPRLQPIDFEKNSYTPPGASWPISYKDLESYYEQAERVLRVRGGKDRSIIRQQLRIIQFHPTVTYRLWNRC